MTRGILLLLLFFSLNGLPGLSPSGIAADGPSLVAFKNPGGVSGTKPSDFGPPLPDREINLRARGAGVYPIEILPGVIYEESGPVKLWDEVSTEGDPAPAPRNDHRP